MGTSKTLRLRGLAQRVHGCGVVVQADDRGKADAFTGAGEFGKFACKSLHDSQII